MNLTHTYAGEYYGKRGKIRTGPKVQYHGMSDGKSSSPDDIALNKLYRQLSVGEGIDKDTLNGIKNKVKGAEQLRFMNMEVLAQVLIYMDRVGYDITYENFNYNAILPYINKLLQKRKIGTSDRDTEIATSGFKTKETSPVDLEISRLRMAATFLRYIRFVLIYQKEKNKMIENAIQISGLNIDEE